MEHHRISKILNDSAISKFMIRKWIEISNFSGNQYFFNKNISFKTPMLRSNLCD